MHYCLLNYSLINDNQAPQKGAFFYAKMINSSKRSEAIQEYYFSRKLREVELMKSKGADVINLGIGSPDLAPSESVIKALEECANNSHNHGYQSYIGIKELRNAFSEWYKKYFNVHLDPDSEILPLMGSKEGIMHISMAYVNPGEKVLVPNPGYPTYTSVTNLVGAEVINYNLTERNNWYPSLEELEDTDLTDVKLMWINYPHMPTGQKASKRVFEQLVRFAHNHSILLCNDNPYSFILNDDYISLLSVDGAKDISLELNSVSKSHNMPGWRIGMVAGRGEYIKEIIKVKSNMDSGMFRPVQMAAATALQSGDEWYQYINGSYRVRRELAGRILDTLGCIYDKDQRGMFLWGRVPAEFSGGEQMADHLLYNAHVFITPGIVFGTGGENYVRISLCANESLLSETLSRIKSIKK